MKTGWIVVLLLASAIRAEEPFEALVREINGGGMSGAPVTMLFAWSPDGKTIATNYMPHASKRIMIWDVATSKLKTTLKATHQINDLAWSPDSKTLATAGADKAIHLIDPNDGKEKARLTGHTKRAMIVSWRPDGKAIASSGEDDTVRVWDVATAKETAALKLCVRNNLSWAPDGKGIAMVGAATDRKVRIWDPVADKETIIKGEGLDFRTERVVWSPDGKLLACSCYDPSNAGSSPIRIWDIAANKETAVLINISYNRSVEWSPDGKTLAAGVSNVIQLWDVAGSKKTESFAGHLVEISKVCWKTDGKAIASVDRFGYVRIWTLPKAK